jgi:hypothetical protein
VGCCAHAQRADESERVRCGRGRRRVYAAVAWQHPALHAHAVFAVRGCCDLSGSSQTLAEGCGCDGAGGHTCSYGEGAWGRPPASEGPAHPVEMSWPQLVAGAKRCRWAGSDLVGASAQQPDGAAVALCPEQKQKKPRAQGQAGRWDTRGSPAGAAARARRDAAAAPSVAAAVKAPQARPARPGPPPPPPVAAPSSGPPPRPSCCTASGPSRARRRAGTALWCCRG